MFNLFLPKCFICGLAVRHHQANHKSQSQYSKLCEFCSSCLLKNLIHCEICALPLEHSIDAQMHCAKCQKKRPYFDKTISSYIYTYPLNRLVSAFKYSKRIDLIKHLSHLMIEDIQCTYADTDLPQMLIPVPLHQWRLLHRGYNQAELIASHLSKALNISCQSSLIKRSRATPKQTGLNLSQRQKNLHNAFIVTNPIRQLKHIALIDDVMTTGTTVNTVSQLLKQSGIERVDVWCIARAVV